MNTKEIESKYVCGTCGGSIRFNANDENLAMGWSFDCTECGRSYPDTEVTELAKLREEAFTLKVEGVGQTTLYTDQFQEDEHGVFVFKPKKEDVKDERHDVLVNVARDTFGFDYIGEFDAPPYAHIDSNGTEFVHISTYPSIDATKGAIWRLELEPSEFKVGIWNTSVILYSGRSSRKQSTRDTVIMKKSRMESVRTGWGDTLKVGDVFKTSWGYDQTNYDFIVITGFSESGKTAICRSAIAHVDDDDSGRGYDHLVPTSEPYGDEFRMQIKKYEYRSTPETYLVGSYPFCSDGRLSDGTRKDHFTRVIAGRGYDQTAAGWGH